MPVWAIHAVALFLIAAGVFWMAWEIRCWRFEQPDEDSPKDRVGFFIDDPSRAEMDEE